MMSRASWNWAGDPAESVEESRVAVPEPALRGSERSAAECSKEAARAERDRGRTGGD